MTHISEWEIAARLLLSCVLSGLIGLERESHGRPAGLRTHILVSLGSCLVMLVSIFGFSFAKVSDPGRLAAQVVSGIGFLGAGTILREGATVKGLTTAASLWVVAGIGLAMGSGFYSAGLIVTLFSVLILLFLEPVEKRLFTIKTYHLLIVYDFVPENTNLLTTCSLFGWKIKHLEIEFNESNNEAIFDIILEAKNLTKEEVLAEIMKQKNVKRVIWK